jgi:hypothetical protein
MSVNIGVISQAAQSTAYVPDTQQALYLATNNDIFSTDQNYTRYAMMEKNRVRADGSMVFPPTRVLYSDKKSGYISNGLVSDGAQALRLQFPSAVTVHGVTIDFGEVYPTAFTIATNVETVTVTGNTQKVYVSNNTFENAQYFIITATSMVGVYQRFRIEKIMFGVGVALDNTIIQTSTLKTRVSEISDELPQIDFNVTVNNLNGKFDIDNPDNIVNYFEVGQRCTIQYGYELDDGTIEWIDAPELNIKEWHTDNKVAKFTATDRLDNYTDVYYKGHYDDNGATLYEIAQEVLADMGLLPTEYVLSDTLNHVISHNPMPKVPHKQALQLIANAACCALYVDSSSRIVIENIPTSNVYPMTKDTLTSQPVSTLLEKIKSISVTKTCYTYQVDAPFVELSNSNYTVSATNNTVTIHWDDPAYNVLPYFPGYTSTILEAEQFYLVVQIDNLPSNPIDLNIVVKGRKFIKTTTNYFTREINPEGKAIVFVNPLIDIDAVAISVLDWLTGYYASDKEYSFNYRGDASLEGYDILQLQNDFVANLLCRVYEHELTFNGALSGKIKARRVVDV